MALSLLVVLAATGSAMAQPLVAPPDTAITDPAPVPTPGQTIKPEAKGSTKDFGSTTANPADRLRPGIYPAQPVPPAFAVGGAEAGEAPLDWSVGLRGTYSHTGDTGNYVLRLSPQFTYGLAGTRTDTVLAGGVEIARQSNSDELTLTAASIGATGTLAIDSVTQATGSIGLGYSRDLPGSPGLANGVIVPPEIATGTLGLGVTRQFGKFNLGLDGGLDRTVYGATTRSDTGVTDNSDQNHWSGNTGLRLGYQITPIIEVYGRAELERDVFDQPAAATGIYANATNHILRAGVEARWNSIWSANASIGVGQRVFDAESLGEITAQLYSANLTYSPNATLRLNLGLDSTLAPPGADNPGSARIEHALLADAQYIANSWLRLRASAGVSTSELVGAATTENRTSLGAGADYLFNSHASLNADYGFTKRDNSASGQTDTHQVSVGITISR